MRGEPLHHHHLTNPPDPHPAAAELTYAGQASWAVVDSPNHCRECRFWAPGRSASRGGRGRPQLGHFSYCGRFLEITHGRPGPFPTVPGFATACVLFEPVTTRPWQSYQLNTPPPAEPTEPPLS